MATMNQFGLLNQDSKSKKDSYLSPKKVLPEEEYEKYKEAKVEEARRKYLETSKKLQPLNKYLSSQENYARTKTGKIASKTTKLFQGATQRKPITSFLYNRNKPASVATAFTSGNSYGKRGRPKGTLDPRYASVGGVYEARKLASFQRRKALLELKSQTNISPAQRQVLQNIQARDNARRNDIEKQTIPDTTGNTYSGSYQDEINSYANLVP